MRIVLATLLALVLGMSMLPSRSSWHGGGGPCGASQPEAPAGATTWGFTKCLFSATFPDLNRVDVNNTKSCASNYQWWTQVAWPFGFNGDGATPAGNMSINANGMGLLASTNADNVSLTTAVHQGGNSYCGLLFDASKGFFVEIVASLNSSVEGNPHSSFWMVPIEAVNNGSTPWVEDDIMEVIDSSGSVSNLHQWGGSPNHIQLTSCTSLSGPMNTSLHTYAKAIVPASLNGGVGLRQGWFDNSHVAGTDVTYSAGGSAACSSGSPAGTYSVADSEHFMLILGGPFIAVQSVRAWGPP